MEDTRLACECTLYEDDPSLRVQPTALGFAAVMTPTPRLPSAIWWNMQVQQTPGELFNTTYLLTCSLPILQFHGNRFYCRRVFVCFKHHLCISRSSLYVTSRNLSYAQITTQTLLRLQYDLHVDRPLAQPSYASFQETLQ